MCVSLARGSSRVLFTPNKRTFNCHEVHVAYFDFHQQLKIAHNNMSGSKRRSNRNYHDDGDDQNIVIEQARNALAVAKCSDVDIIETRRSSISNKSEPREKPTNSTNIHQQLKQTGNPRSHSYIKMIIRLIIVCLILVIAIRQTSTNWLNSVTNIECQFRECCHPNDNTNYIRYEKGCDILRDTLKEKVHGQPFITKKIYSALKAHLTNNQPPRPLVMYFSGWTGTGKTYVAKLIASSLYKEGMKSRFVKHIIASYEFPTKVHDEHQITVYRQRLRDMIRETVLRCERSLIIFDELDKLPAGIVDSLQPLLDYIEDIDGVKYNKAIFIFLSNTGSESLNQLAYQKYKEGKERKDLSSKDIEEILIRESFSETGGFKDSSIVKRYSIGVLVPFLPLERKHVKLCVEDELDALEVIANDRDKLVEEIADELLYYPEETQLYSKSGCKGVHDKVINYIGSPAEYNTRGDREL